MELDAPRLTAYGLDPSDIAERIEEANRQSRTGSIPSHEAETLIETGGFLHSSVEVGAVVVGVHQGQLVYLRDVAQVLDGPEEPVDYVLFGHGFSAEVGVSAQIDGAGPRPSNGDVRPAVTLAVAKRPGTNAIDVGTQVLEKVALLKGGTIPVGVEVTVTRNYGRTATDKSNELLLHMGLAVAGVSLLVALVLGWREAFVVAIAIPVTLALTLATFYLLGFTLNRVTLFALIFSIGILVDDPIVDVENIVRHFRLPENRGVPLAELVIDAVNEVRSPLILATLTVIAAVLPMAFVQGLMGPYMRPIPIGATAAMLFSMAVSFIVTPWAANRLLGKLALHRPERPRSEDWSTRLYRRVMGPLIRNHWWGRGFLLGITLLLFGAMALVGLGAVKVKMLPFDNKSELQLIIDMDEGTTLEQTARVARELAIAVQQEPEVTDYQIYVGTAAPYNFNGLVRHYFLRRGPNVADVQVNLAPKEEREAQSHAIAKRLRAKIQPIAAQHGARVKVAEVPPGPPVLQTLVAEIYGPDYARQIENARQVRAVFERTPGVVDVDWYMEEDQPQLIFHFDQEKAGLHRISAERVEEVLRIAEAGMDVGLLHVAGEVLQLAGRQAILPADQVQHGRLRRQVCGCLGTVQQEVNHRASMGIVGLPSRGSIHTREPFRNVRLGPGRGCVLCSPRRPSVPSGRLEAGVRIMIVLAVLAAAGFADSAVIYEFPDGRTVAVLATEDLEMAAESVLIAPDGGLYPAWEDEEGWLPLMDVWCVFHLVNLTDEPVDVTVGFPLDAKYGDAYSVMPPSMLVEMFDSLHADEDRMPCSIVCR